jgi:glutamate racemase
MKRQNNCRHRSIALRRNAWHACAMIGIFDSGHGGLTVLRALVARFPTLHFLYLGDHANGPYGNRPSQEIVALTRAGVAALFRQGCRLVLLGCNTATCVAARTLQREWLPNSAWRSNNILGIVAPTVEAATQTPWAVTTPQYPQKYNTDLIAVFGTTRTITSLAFPEEIRKRCPKVKVVQQTCANLAGAIENGAGESELGGLVKLGVDGLLAQTSGTAPHRAILGCTHYPLVEPLFRQYLPASTRLLSQPEVVADSLDDYLARHPRFRDKCCAGIAPNLLTTGEPLRVGEVARRFWPECPAFMRITP